MINASKVLYLIAVGQLIRNRHWQTTSYAEHQALGGLYEAVSDFTDLWVEMQQGAMAIRVDFPIGSTVPVTNVATEEVGEILEGLVAFLRGPLLDESDGSEFANMRDELLSKVQKTLYLLSLH